MKRLFLAILIAGVVVGLTATPLCAQKYKGEVVISPQAGFSLVGSVVRISFKVSDYDITGLKTRVTPGLTGNIDVGLTDRISLGAAYFVQYAKAEWSAYTDSVADTTYRGDFKFGALRTNYGFRMLLHFGSNDAIDPYFGFRFGYGQWKFSGSTTAVELYDKRYFKKGFTIQAVFGARYYFLPFLGVNAEVAFGYPYFLTTGISFKFGGDKYLD